MTSHDNGEHASWSGFAQDEPGDEQGQRQDIELSELDELPDTPVPLDRFGSASDDEHQSLSARLAEEVPDVGVPDANAEQDPDSEPIADAVPTADLPRPPVGPLIVLDDEGGNDPLDPYGNQDSFADAAQANGMSAEEAAIREVDEEGDAQDGVS
jgi:hypothetical protein